eukprot:1184123-Prorocentrum_minimum.AAC.3
MEDEGNDSWAATEAATTTKAAAKGARVPATGCRSVARGGWAEPWGGRGDYGGAVPRAGRRTGTTDEGQRNHSAGGQGGATGGGGRKARGRKEGTQPSEEPGRQGCECEKDKDRQSG